MSKQVKDCFAHKTRLIEEIKQMTTVQPEELSAYAYQLDQLVDKMRGIVQKHTFRSRTKEQHFYEQVVTETLIYYWYVRELAQFYCGFPINPAHEAAYTYERGQHYQNYISLHFQPYTAFCAKKLSFDYTELQTLLLQEDAPVSCCFFDEQHPSLYFIYFSALQLILNHINAVLLPRFTVESQSPLLWSRSKLDLCLVVYGMYHCTKTDHEKGSILEWAKEVGNLFGMEINKNFYQTISEFKKRKDIRANFIAEMNQLILDKCKDWE